MHLSGNMWLNVCWKYYIIKILKTHHCHALWACWAIFQTTIKAENCASDISYANTSDRLAILSFCKKLTGSSRSATERYTNFKMQQYVLYSSCSFLWPYIKRCSDQAANSLMKKSLNIHLYSNQLTGVFSFWLVSSLPVEVLHNQFICWFCGVQNAS